MRKFLAAILLFFTFTTLCAKEMELYKNFDGAEEFATLTVEEQYNSYINSFKKIKDPMTQPSKWAYRMVEQYGREVLPYFNNTLYQLNLDNVYRKPYDSTFTCLYWLIRSFLNENIFTEDEKELYAQFLINKVDAYLLKYRIVDRTVYYVYVSIYDIYERILKRVGTVKWDGWEKFKEDKEKQLGISLEMGDMTKMWED